MLSKSINYLVLVLAWLHGVGDERDNVLPLQQFDLHQHPFAAGPARAPQSELVLRLFLHLSLDVFDVLGAVVSHQREVGLQQGPVGAEPGAGHLLVLGLPREKVEEVDDQAHAHQDLKVVVLPIVSQVGWDFGCEEERKITLVKKINYFHGIRIQIFSYLAILTT